MERTVALDPSVATYLGIAGHDHELADLSADGFAERAELDRSTLAALEAAEAPGLREQVARTAMAERLALDVERYDAGDTTSELNVIASWVQWVRQLFDLMPTDGEESAANVARRMAAVPEAYRQLSRDLARRGPERPAPGPAAGRGGRQAVRRLGQAGGLLLRRAGGAADRGAGPAARGAGRGRPRGDGRHGRARRLPPPRAAAAGPGEGRLRARGLRPGLAVLPRRRRGPAGGLRLELGGDRPAAGRAGAGQRPDQAGSHPGRRPWRSWTATRPGASKGARTSAPGCRNWPSAPSSELHGTHFDIPEPARRIEAMIAPASDGGIYYIRPSEDWSRPGRMWWSVPDGMDTFSTWKEVTIVYHEGVPGHHLQISQTMAEQENLNRWQRLMCWVSGHGEGWALYAERLMGELGYLERPGRAPRDARRPAAVRRPGGRGHRGAPGAGDPHGHRLARGRALERRDRLGVPAGPLQPGRRAAAFRAAPLPRLARAGPVLQAGRADLAPGQG